MNICRNCDQDFVTVEAFDEHRVGVHAYTFAEGLKLGVEDGRRCLDVDELAGMGWTGSPWRYPRDWVKQAAMWDHVVPEAERV